MSWSNIRLYASMSMADIIGVPATQGDVGWGETAKQTTPAPVPQVGSRAAPPIVPGTERVVIYRSNTGAQEEQQPGLKESSLDECEIAIEDLTVTVYLEEVKMDTNQ